MRVGLNATCLTDRPSGAKQRFIGIYGQLFKLLPEVEFIIYESQGCRVADWFPTQPNVSAKVTSIPCEGRIAKFAAGIRYWPQEFSKDRFDIFEGLHLPLTRSPSGRTLLTIHDIRGVHPENDLMGRAIFKTVLARSLKAADHVITVSEAMKEEILSFFPGIHVSVIYNGLDTSKFSQIDDSDLVAFQNKFALPSEFILAVGHFEKRKNYLSLIDSVIRLRDRGIDCPLLIIGNNSGQRQLVEEKIAGANLGNMIRVLSELSDLEVRCAYKMCSLFVFPSAYEGFGIPILEAMAAQRPMVLSNLPVFCEITEGQAIYFPHNDIESMADAIEHALTSSTKRTSMIEYGIQRVNDFNFNALAGQVAALYKELVD